MKLGEMQDFVVDRLLASRVFAGVGLALNAGILKEDGTYPKTEFLEQSLTRRGLAIIVWEIQALESDDDNTLGGLVHDVWIPIIIEDIPAINLSPNGTGMKWQDIVEEIQASIVGKNEDDATPGSKPFCPGSLPFKNLGTEDGVHRCVVHIIKRHVITPK